MICVEGRSAIDEPWLSMRPVRIGDVPEALSTPEMYFLVSEGEPIMRVDYYAPSDEGSAFKAHQAWREWVVLGLGDRVYLVHLRSRECRQVRLGSYFGQLWPAPDFLLVASARHVFKLDAAGDLVWQSAEVGIDGVVFKSVSEEFVSGEGEWDPPGGWRPFRLSTSSGRAA